jgi:hypothetical protein
VLLAQGTKAVHRITENSNYTNWTLDKPTANQIHIEAKRIATVPGTHGNL